MEVRKGYKQTEIGNLPDEWDVVTLEKVAQILDPQPDHRTPPSVFSGEPYIGISDFIDDRTVNWDTTRKIISKAVDKQQASFRIELGDIIFGKIGTIGQPKFVPVVPFRYALSANVLLIKPTIKPYFLISWLQSSTCQTAINRELHSTSQAAFGINKMRQVLIPVPSLAEQEAIAEALSDADALIESLETLLAKKRQVKQGAMSELLSGKRRLPGFSDEWKDKKLGELSEMGSGGTPLSSNPDYYNGNIPWVSIADMTKSGKFISTTENNLTVAGLNSSSAQMFPKGTVLYAMYASLGECSIAEIPLCTSQAILGIRVKPNLSNEFLFYFLSFLKPQVKTMGQQGTQSNLNKGMVQNFQLKLPTLPEQTAIAEILSDMDAEIRAVEEKLSKARAVKAGMMSELLTGRVRLV